MRENIGKAVKVKAGSPVTIKLSLPKSADYARISVWSAVQGYELSPHVQIVGEMAVRDGLPPMLRPIHTTLSKDERVKTLEFIADDSLTIQAVQEKDLATEPSAKARIYVKSKIAAALGRGCRNIGRFIRRANEGCHWPKRDDPVVHVQGIDDGGSHSR